MAVPQATLMNMLGSPVTDVRVGRPEETIQNLHQTPTDTDRRPYRMLDSQINSNPEIEGPRGGQNTLERPYETVATPLPTDQSKGSTSKTFTIYRTPLPNDSADAIGPVVTPISTAGPSRGTIPSDDTTTTTSINPPGSSTGTAQSQASATPNGPTTTKNKTYEWSPPGPSKTVDHSVSSIADQAYNTSGFRTDPVDHGSHTIALPPTHPAIETDPSLPSKSRDHSASRSGLPASQTSGDPPLPPNTVPNPETILTTPLDTTSNPKSTYERNGVTYSTPGTTSNPTSTFERGGVTYSTLDTTSNPTSTYERDGVTYSTPDTTSNPTSTQVRGGVAYATDDTNTDYTWTSRRTISATTSTPAPPALLANTSNETEVRTCDTGPSVTRTVVLEKLFPTLTLRDPETITIDDASMVSSTVLAVARDDGFGSVNTANETDVRTCDNGPCVTSTVVLRGHAAVIPTLTLSDTGNLPPTFTLSEAVVLRTRAHETGEEVPRLAVATPAAAASELGRNADTQSSGMGLGVWSPLGVLGALLIARAWGSGKGKAGN